MAVGTTTRRGTTQRIPRGPDPRFQILSILCEKKSSAECTVSDSNLTLPSVS